MVSANLLIAWFNVAFDHKAFYKIFKFWVNKSAVQDFLGDTDLLFILLIGIGMVRVNDHSRILQIPFPGIFPREGGDTS